MLARFESIESRDIVNQIVGVVFVIFDNLIAFVLVVLRVKGFRSELRKRLVDIIDGSSPAEMLVGLLNDECKVRHFVTVFH